MGCNFSRITRRGALAVVVPTLIAAGCVPRAPRPPEVSEGIASYYAIGHHGHRTASGERYDMYDYTAAHETLPFGTKVRVTNLDNGKSVTVRINDRGPFRKGRIIDLSWAAARKLKFLKEGTARVRLAIEKIP